MTTTPGSRPMVSVVVPTRNSGSTLNACLASIRAQDFQSIELIVVDNYSTDATPQIAQRMADVVLAAGPERSAQRNSGIAATRGEYVLWIDADMVLGRSVVSDAVDAARAVDADGVFIREVTIGDGYWAHCRALERLCYLGEALIESPRLVRREFFARSGGFHHAIAGQEDAEIRVRLLAEHATLARSEQEIQHLEGGTRFVDVLRKRFYYGRSIPAFTAAAPGAARVQALVTVRALARHWRLLGRHPLLVPGIVVMRACELVAYAAGALSAGRHR